MKSYVENDLDIRNSKIIRMQIEILKMQTNREIIRIMEMERLFNRIITIRRENIMKLQVKILELQINRENIRITEMEKLVDNKKKEESDKRRKIIENRKNLRKSVNIRLLNVRGLTLDKWVEMQNKYYINNPEANILCLTETHHKTERFQYNEGLNRIDVMREISDKGGGGIQLVTKKRDGLTFKKIENKNPDFLELEGKLLGIETKMIIVYMDSDKGKEGIERNTVIRKAVEERIINNEKKGLMILGDFNGHLSLLENRKEDMNGKMVLEWMEEFGLTLLNATKKCKGVFTRIERGQKSAIDLVLVNKEIYGICENMEIDEEKREVQFSDHNMITLTMKNDKEKGVKMKKGKWIEKTYYKNKT